MKSLNDRIQNLQGPGVLGDVAVRVAEIFQQHPLLCGFSVQDRSTLTLDRASVCLDGKLYLADVAVNIPPGFRVAPEYCDEIASMLVEMMNEQPGVSRLLAGCTFARTVH